ncbi:MAG: DUF4198 domain-containing protein, partial [Methylococcaceae bacterium]
HEKVGQDFKGNQYVYLDSSYQFLNITQSKKTHAVKSRLGDLPAISETVTEEGLVILSAETTPSDVTYETWDKFSSFIKSKGLDWVLAKHKERKLPEKNFVESYRRFAKSLIKVGHGKGKDRALGLGFEWVVETNPYTAFDTASNIKKQITIKAQLLWKGKPHAKAHVSVFNKVEGDIIKSELTTDENGRVEIPRARGGMFLINAVQMIEAPKNMIKERSAVWESHWASVTYRLD